jgi:hypothetical protein
MAADLPENYESTFSVYQRRSCRLDENTLQNRGLHNDKAKGKESWFLGAITDENARKKYLDFNQW